MGDAPANTKHRLAEALRGHVDLYDALPIGLVTFDRRGLIEEMNATAAELLATDRKCAVGRPFRGFVDVNDHQAFADHLCRCASAVGPVATELGLRGRDGRTVPTQVCSGPARPGTDAPCHRTALIDLTELRRAEAERQRERVAIEEKAAGVASDAKERFLGLLSHELRNPLTSITNSLYVLDRATPGGEQARHAQAVIERQVRHLSRLVDDLLDLTRITRGKITLQRRTLELNALVLATANDHRSLFDQSGIQLDVSVARMPLHVDGDPVRITQVLGNLLQNAAKFTERGGRTSMSVERRTGKALVRVRDDGIGIAATLLPHIFDPFVQADESLARTRGGLGLGLTLVKSVVELHGGAVSARSDGLGKGAEFDVLLPLVIDASGAVASTSVAPPEGPLRVLVIDDDQDVSDSLRQVLELDGHVVEVARDGAHGIERARAFGPQVVLCDIGLPDIDGYAVARAFRADEALHSVFLVALTGYAMLDAIAQAIEAGFDSHLAKPPGENLAAILAGAGAQVARRA